MNRSTISRNVAGNKPEVFFNLKPRFAILGAFAAAFLSSCGSSIPTEDILQQLDTTAPELVTFTVSSSGGSTATVGETITARVVANENIKQPTLTILGVSDQLTFLGSGTTWTATATLGAVNQLGEIRVLVVVEDLAGNQRRSDQLTDSNLISFVAPSLPPVTLSGVSIVRTSGETPTPQVGDELTVVFASSRDLEVPPQVLIGGQFAQVSRVSGSSAMWSAVVEISNSFVANPQGFEVKIVVPEGAAGGENLSVGAMVSSVSDTASVLEPTTTTPFVLVPVLSYVSGSISVVSGQPISAITLTNRGDAPTTNGCQASSLPNGLSIGVSEDNSSCTITGMPDAVEASTDFMATITATNATGTSAELSLAITVTPPNTQTGEPVLANIADRLLAVGQDVGTISFDNTGGAPTATSGCTVMPNLPARLMVSVSSDGSTCVISGTPEATLTRTEYTVTAANSAGSDDATITITVNEAVSVPVLSATSLTATAVDGTAIATLTVANTGGNLASCQFVAPDSGNLVATIEGLNIALTADNRTCEVTGTLTGAGLKDFTIRASNPGGSDEVSVRFTVNPAAPSLPDTTIAATVVDGVSVGTVTITNSGGNPDTCQFVDPADDTGNTLAATFDGVAVAVATNNTDCEITGTLTGTGLKDFTVRATNATGSDDAAVQFTVNPAAPSLPDTTIAATVVDGVSVGTVTITNSGGNPDTCQFVDPADDTGNTLAATFDGVAVAVATNNTDCEITGTLTGTGLKDFTVRATNATGSDDAAVQFTVNPAAPSLPDTTIAATVVDGVSVGTVTITNSGGNPDTCQFVDPADDTGNTLAATFDGVAVAVATNNTDCEITGTLTGTGLKDFTVRATNATGSDDAAVQFTVNPAAPSLPDTTIAATVVDGVSVGTVTVTNSGGNPDTCQFVDPADDTGNTLAATLDGVAVAVATNNTDCEITGTLTGAGLKDFTVRATNATGSDDATVQFTVNPAAPSLPDTTIAATVVDGVSVGTVTITNSGGNPDTCQFVDPADDTSNTLAATLDGVAVAVATNNTDCEITGTLTGTGLKDFTVRATNATGSDDATVQFTVNPAAPSLPDTTIAATVVDGVSVGTVTITNSGGNPDTCQFVDPADDTSNTLAATLDGVAVAVATNNTDCEITGTLTGTGLKDFTVRATNATGSDDAAVQFTVNPAAPSLPDTTIAATVVDGASVGTVTVTNSGGNPDTCQFVDPADDTSNTLAATLDGVAVAVATNNTDCEITGTLTGTGLKDFTVRATNATGSDDATVRFTVNPIAPSLQTLGAQSYPTGVPVNVELVNTGGGELTECTVNNTPPNGLSVARNAGNDSCVITGDPDTATAAADFDITATNITDSSTITVSIAVVSGVAIFANPDPLVYVVGDSVNESFVNTNTDGGRVNDCTSTSTLPAGLSVAALASPDNGCALTGTANTITTQANYTITATNGNGEASLTLDITVNPIAPSLQTLGAQSYPTGVPVNVELVNTGGGELTECTVNNTPPNGLSVARNAGNDSCVITGDPDTATAAADFDITATNITDSSTITVSIAVVSGVAIFANPDPLVYVVGDSVNESFVNTNTDGGRVNDCTSTSALPAGLSVAALASPDNGCALTGTANTITTQANYTITATNGNGEASLTLDITVNPVAPDLPDTTVTATVVDGASAGTVTVTNTAGNPDSCQFVDPADDTGNTLVATLDGVAVAVATNDTDCEITGSLTGVGMQTFTVRATNATDSDDATVQFTVNPAAPVYAEATKTFAIDAVRTMAIADTTLATTGSALSASGCVFVDALNSTTPAADSRGLNIAVATDNQGCALTGTPTTTQIDGNNDTFTLYVRAFNDVGSDWATLNVDIAPLPPELTDPAGQIELVVGRTDNLPITIANTADPATTCEFSSATQIPILTSLNLEMATLNGGCIIRLIDTGLGGPTMPAVAADYGITATNAGGPHEAVASIIIRLPRAPTLVAPNADALSVELGADLNTTPIIIANSALEVGAQIASDNCELVDSSDSNTAMVVASNAVDGLGIDTDSDTCRITGSPTSIGNKNLNVRATSTEGEASAIISFVVVVNDIAPIIAIDGASTYNFNTAEAITSITFTATGGAITGCTASPALPASLSINATTCEISGTIDSPIAPATSHDITASNNTGATDSNTVTITIGATIPAPALAVMGGTTSFVYTQDGNPITNIVLTNTSTNTGAQIDTCAIEAGGNSLPSGLAVNAVGNTCVISGTPTVTATATSHAIVATGTGGETSTPVTVDITVNPVAPSLQTLGAQSHPTGVSVNIELTNTGGGELTECTVNNTLPNGLSVARNAGNDSCVITGTPDTAMVAADYMITATNITDSSTITVSIAVVSGVATFADPGSLVYVVGDSVNESFVNTNTSGGRVNDCTSTSTLPDGLSVAALASPDNGCVLTGTANTITTQANYTVTATNGNGEASLTLDITVNPVAPSLQTLGAQSYPTGVSVNVELTNTGGGELTECTVNNTLPNGLSVARNAGNDSCVITGTPDTATVAADYMITATNITDSSTITVSIAVVSGVASFTDPGSLVYVVGDSVNESFVNTNTDGGRVNDCTSTSTLPAGLSVDEIASPGNGCALTGTANTITTQANYTITATNDNGEASLTLDITVNPVAPDLPDTTIAATVVDGASVGTVTVTNSGGNPDTCQFVDPADDTDNTLVATLDGVAVAAATNNTDCEITGSLTGVGTQTFTVRATNATDSDDATVQFTVNPAAPVYAEATKTFAIDAVRTMAIADTTLATTGSALSASGCVFVDALNSTTPAADSRGLNIAVATDNQGCALTGTPTTTQIDGNNEAFTLYVRAFNDVGSDWATLNVDIAPLPPELTDPAGQIELVVGRTDNLPITIANTADPATTCEFSSATQIPILTSLNLEMATLNGGCIIRLIDEGLGGPTMSAVAANYGITATNAGGPGEVTARIIIRLPRTPTLVAPNADALSVEIGADLNATPIIITNSATGAGAQIASDSCELVDSSDAATAMVVASNAVDGLGIDTDSDTCRITGSPTSIGNKNLNIRATSTEGEASAIISFVVVVNDIAPIIAVNGASTYNFNTAEAITPITFTATGGAITDCTASPALPASLSINATTCEISGTIDSPIAPATSHDITASNNTGTTNSNTVTITIGATTPAPVLEVMGGTTSFVYTQDGNPITNIVLTNTSTNSGAQIDTCAIEAGGNSLPSGLAVNAVGNTCVISGTPTVTATATSHAIVATGTGGETSTPVTVDITVNPAAPSLQTLGAQSHPTGVSVNVELTNTGGGELTECTVNNTLPNGLSVARNADNSTCIITGTPDTATLAADYMITATNITDSSTITVSIAVVSGVASFTDPGSLVYVVGDSVNESFVNTNTSGGRVNDCTSTSTLPAGLSVDEIASPGNGCALTGTANAITEPANYTVTATNGNGEASLTLDITVNPIAPDLPDTTVAETVVDGASVGTVTVTNSGGNPDTCQFVDPADNSLVATLDGIAVAVATNNTDCEITGSLTGTGMQTFTVRATNATNTDNATVQFTVTAAAPVYAEATKTFAIDAVRTMAIADTTLATTGNALSANGCVFVDALNSTTPAADSRGLSAAVATDNQGCALTGTPTTTQMDGNNDTFTLYVRAFNDVGSDWATVNVDIAPLPPELTDPAGQIELVVGRTDNLPITIANTADPATTCEFSSATQIPILTSLNLEMATLNGDCIIRLIDEGLGGPTMSAVAANYGITATNAGGPGEATANIIIRLPRTPTLVAPAADALSVEIGADLNATPIIITNSATGAGAQIASDSCELVDSSDSNTAMVVASNAVDGLSIDTDSDTCRITGSPTSIGNKNLNIRATSTEGEVSAIISFVVVVNDIAPIIAIDGASTYNFNTAEAITPITFTATGGAITGCTASPAVPASLSLNTTTCEIFGTIDSPIAPATSHDITASNNTGATNSNTVTITIGATTPAPALAVMGGTTSFVYTQDGNPITNIVLTNTSTNSGAQIDTCAIEAGGNSLPSGLAVNAVSNTCVISGTPTVTATATSHAIVATGTGGETSTPVTVDITVNPAAPSLQTLGAQSHPTGVSVNVELTNTGGGELTECTANNTLPNGLSVARNAGNDSCVITGTPDTATLAADYMITATNITDSSTITVSIAVVSGVASFTDPGSLVYVVGDSVNESFVNTNTSGGRVNDCTSTSTLPAGLSVAALASPDNGCALTGTANTITTQANYTVTATNGNGEASLTLDITVNPVAPDLPDTTVAETVVDGASVGTVTVTNSGGNPDTCQFVDPADNSLVATLDGIAVAVATNNTDCEITGSLTGTGMQTFTVRATNATNTDNATVQFTVTAAAPVYAEATKTFAIDAVRTMAIADTTLATTGNALSANGCVFVDALNSTTPAADSRGLNAAVATDNQGCALTGTPTSTQIDGNNDTFTLYVRAFNDGGSDWATLNVDITPLPPELTDPAGQIELVVGRTDNLPITIANTADPATICEFSSATQIPILTSLNLEMATLNGGCIIRLIDTGLGGPTGVQASRDYDITATNAGGPGEATANIIIRLPRTPTLVAPNADALSVELGADLNATPIIITNSATGAGAQIASDSCELVDSSDSNTAMVVASNAVDGLGIDTDSDACRITGSPTSIGNKNFNIRATSTEGEVSAILSLLVVVNDIAPIIAIDGASTYNFNTAEPITPITFTATGGAITDCIASPAVPASLSINATTCEISGTIDSPIAPATSHDITASNNTGATDSNTVTIIIGATIPAPALAVMGGTTSFVYTQDGNPITNIVLTNTSTNSGAQINTCTIEASSNSLPSGLAVNAVGNTCVISGTPTVTATATSHAIVATGTGGETSTPVTVDITVNPAAPSLTDATAQTYYLGQSGQTITLVNTGGAPTDDANGCTVNPVLPQGLSVQVSADKSTCIITGTPTALKTATTYTVTATNITGPDEAVVEIGVRAPHPPTLDAPASEDLILTVDVAIDNPITIANSNPETGAQIATNSCALVNDTDPATATPIPDGVFNGLSVNTGVNACGIIGTPDALGDSTLNIRATSAEGGMSILTVTVTVNPLAPDLSPLAAQTTTIGGTVSLTFANAGGNPDLSGCTASPASLPAGLSLARTADGGSCVIDGTVDASATLGEQTYTITASNSGGMSMVSFSITVNQAAPNLPATTPISAIDKQSIGTVLLTNTGGNPDNCWFVDPDDNTAMTVLATLDGLSVAVSADNSTCAITGTTSGVGTATYLVRATNASGTSETSAEFTIAATAPVVPATLTPANEIDGQSISALSIINTGSALDTCRFVDPADGDGLTEVSSLTGLNIVVDGNGVDCLITGTLSGTGMQAFTVRATNAGGSAESVVTFTVDVAAPDLGMGPISRTVVSGESITSVVINNTGGDIDSDGCEFVDSMGNDIDASTLTITVATASDSCTISGSLSGTGLMTFFIRATNTTATSGISVEFTVNPPAPDLPDAAVTANAVDSQSITTLTIANSGGAADSCRFVDPGDASGVTEVSTLSGLTIAVASNGTDCEITGSLTGVGEQTFTVRATNTNTSDTATVTITVFAADWVVLDQNGIAASNTLTVLTSASGDFSDEVSTTDSMGSAKLTWMLNGTTGELTVSVTNATGAAVLLTRLDPEVDLSNYAQGEISFEINVTSYGSYTNMVARIECGGCAMMENSLGTPGSSGWETVRIPISQLTTNGLDLTRVTTGIALYPALNEQSGQELTFMVRNIHWSSMVTQ